MLKVSFSISSTILIALLIGLFVMLYFWVGGLKHQNTRLQQEIEEGQRGYLELKENIARAESKMVSKGELKRMLREAVDPAIRELINKNRETVKLISKVEGSLRGSVEELQLEPVVVEKEKYQVKQFSSRISLPEGPPIAWWRVDSQGLAMQGLYQMKFNVKTTLTEQKSKKGYNVYNELWLTSPEFEEWKDRPYPIPIDRAEVRWVPIKRAKSFYSFLPKMDIGLEANLAGLEKPALGFSIGASLMGYGQSEDDLEWRFLRLSAGAVGDKVNLGFAPVSWNIGKHLPLVSDLWLYSGIIRELKTNGWRYFVGLSTIF
ncbi:hypothetical protein CEE39_08580 [bacterium (candidate division B38) B3_B38]|nr:MAG: hypothetical protein CEE39_08580 [bacterium (candidate division B38) B3_B38]